MKKIFVLIIISLFLTIPKGYGQMGNYTSMQYAMSFGTGDLGDYISKASFRGFTFEYRKEVSDNLLIGADITWNVFYEKKSNDSYTEGNETLSGVQLRYQNSVPILASVEYIFMPTNTLKPYIGLGIGTIYTERSTQMGLYMIEENPWHFALKPELGILYEVSFDVAIKLAAKYYHGFSSGSLDSQGYISIGVGLAFSF